MKQVFGFVLWVGLCPFLVLFFVFHFVA